MNKFYLELRQIGIKHIRILFTSFVMLVFTFVVSPTSAQLVLTNGSNTALINFSVSMPITVGTNPPSAFTGAGFQSNPSAPGLLNSNAWSSEGWSDGDLLYGGTRTTGDYARGTTAVAEITGGIYANTSLPAFAPTLMFQPASNDFNPGTLTLRIKNQGTTIITSLALSYNLFVRNDQPRSSTFNLSYSTDNFVNSDVAVPLYDYTTPFASGSPNWVQVGSSPSRTGTISGLSIAPGTLLYLRWSSADVPGGSLGRDEIGLDDINMTATYSAVCTPPITQATFTSFSNVLQNQVDLNYTRGNGSGVIIVASTSPSLSSNPTSGVTYAGNVNFGNGDPLGGGFVVYNGAANGPGLAATLSVTGLAPSTTYYFFLFEYGSAPPCYKTPGVSGSTTTAVGSGTSPSDYFRAKLSGPWSNAASWESSPDNISWGNATIKPSFLAKGILIKSPYTITLTTNETANLLNIEAGATLKNTLDANGGFDLALNDDISGIDFKIYGTYEMTGKAVTFPSGTTVQVYNGGLVKVTANNGISTSDDFARNVGVYFATGSTYEWATFGAFQSSSATYFPNAQPTDIAKFKVSVSMAAIGASSTTNIQGLFELNGNLTVQNSGTKIFRNGIIGTGTLSQGASSGPISIDGATADLGGTGAINLLAAGSFIIQSGSVTTLITNKQINLGTATVDGTLLCANNVLSGSTIFTLSPAGTLGMGSALGITTGAFGNIQVTGARNFNTAGNYIYNGGFNQVTGNALPATVTGFITVANTGTSFPVDNIVSLTTNNTTTTTLNLNQGLFNVGATKQFNITGGGIINGNGGNDLVTDAGVINFNGIGTVLPSVPVALTNLNLNAQTFMGGGNTTINGTLNLKASSFVQSGTAPTYSSTPASTLLYSCNCNYNIAEEWYPNNFGNSPGVPHHVTLAPGTSANFQSFGVPHEMRGDLTINTGSTLTLSTNTTLGTTGDLYIKGNWTRASGGFFNPLTRTVKFNGVTGDQIITIVTGGMETFNSVIIDKAIGLNLTLAGGINNPTNISITGNGTNILGGNTLQLLNGNIDLNQQTLNFSSYITAQNNIQVTGTSGNFDRNITSTGGQGIFAVDNSNGASRTVTISRLSANPASRANLVFGPTVTVTTSAVTGVAGGINFGVNSPGGYYISTINGILQINTRGFVDINPPIYGNNSTLIYNAGGPFDRNVEWGGTNVQPGYPNNVIVQNSTFDTLNTPINGNADRYLSGNLTVSPGSKLILSSIATVYNNKLTVGANLVLDGSLILPTAFGGDIYVAGNWTRSSTGVFTPNDRAVFFNGPGNSIITSNGGEVFPYLYLTKGSLANTLSLLDDISITKHFGISTGTFVPGNKNAILKSDVNFTAALGKFTATGAVSYSSGTGRFVIERFIPTAPAIIFPNHKKTWQFLATPVSDSAQSVKAAWQEGSTAPNMDPNPGYGTQITSDVINATVHPKPGFDVYTPAGPTMKNFVPASATWKGIDSTLIPIINQKGYMLFVRGDRSVITYNGNGVPTTLRITGKVFDNTTTPPLTNVGLNLFESIGNPFASAIDFSNTAGVVKTGAVQSIFYTWDPRLGTGYGYGAYQTFTKGAGTDYTVTPGGGSYGPSGSVHNIIESGQAFFVRTSGGTGTVTINENAKVSQSRLVARESPAIADRQIRNNLYAVSPNSTILVDGVLTQFDNSYSSAVDILDAVKFLNSTENLGISSGTSILTVERRKNIRGKDSIPYLVSQLRAQDYMFELIPQGVSRPGLHAFLEDKWLRTRTDVSLNDTTRVNFKIESAPASFDRNRFVLVFFQKNRGIVPTILIAIHDKDKVNLSWNGDDEHTGDIYQVERSSDGKSFSALSKVSSILTEYAWTDNNPLSGDSYYRISEPAKAKTNEYSNVVKISSIENSQGLRVYPNPVSDGIIHLSFSNMISGDYYLKLINQAGQEVLSRKITHDQKTEDEVIILNKKFIPGIYKVEINSNNNVPYTERILIN